MATIKEEMEEKEKPEERKVIDGDLADEEDAPKYFGKDKSDEESKEEGAEFNDKKDKY